MHVNSIQQPGKPYYQLYTACHSIAFAMFNLQQPWLRCLRCCHGLWQVLGKCSGSDLCLSELGYKPREHTLGVADVLMFWHLLVGENQEHRISHLILLLTWLGSDFLKWCTHATAPKKRPPAIPRTRLTARMFFFNLILTLWAGIRRTVDAQAHRSGWN